MSVRPGPVHVQILTEDGEGAYPALKALVQTLLQHGHDAYWLQRDGVTFVDAPEQVRASFRGNSWLDPRVRAVDRRLQIAKALATQLASADRGLCIVHVDADRAWSGPRGLPPNQERLIRDILPKVQAELERVQRADRIERLVILVPYAHIESWYFQNTAELRRWYDRHHSDAHPDLVHLDRWDADPGLLDEIVEPSPPKDLLVVGSRHNAELARNYPVGRALDVNKSFAVAYRSLLAVPGLRDWIETHRPTWAGPGSS